MSFTNLNVTQNEFLVSHLRGTGKTISAAQAETTYGIQNLRARMTELRNAGLVVRTHKNSVGRNAYSISARDITGSRANVAI